jgi:hypothetical protein
MCVKDEKFKLERKQTLDSLTNTNARKHILMTITNFFYSHSHCGHLVSCQLQGAGRNLDFLGNT